MSSTPVSAPKAVALVGATGLVGSHILKTLLSHPQISKVTTITRRQPEVSDPQSRLHPLVDPDSTNWASTFQSQPPPPPEIFFSALGTTRGAAGSLAAQRAIDYDLNLALAAAAKKAGCRVYVLISAAGAHSGSYVPYSKMKGELEDAIAGLGFEQCVVLRPGFLLGQRPKMKFGEGRAQAVAGWLGRVSGGRLKDGWAQDAEVVGRAAVGAGVMASLGQAEGGGVWRVGQSEVVRLGRTEWRE